MHFLVPLAGLLGIELESLTERVKTTIILNGVMAVLALIGFVFLIVAGYLALANAVGAIYAASIIAAVFLLLALVLFLTLKVIDNRQRRIASEKRRSSEAGAFMTTATLTALPVIVKSPWLRVVALPAAAVATYLIARNKISRAD